MSRPARVTKVEHLGDLRLRLTYSDDLVRDLDFDNVLSGGILETVRQPEMFTQVAVDSVTGTIVWPNGVDLDPDVLHGDFEPASGAGPVVLSEYHPRPTA